MADVAAPVPAVAPDLRKECAESSIALTAITVFTTAAGCPHPRPPPGLPKSRVLAVPHVAQQLSWDCGLACLLMVLRAAGDASQDLAALHRLCPSQSVWTVDLAHLAARFRLPVRFATLTLGANPGFSGESFYGRLAEDELRVERLFQGAAAAGIEVQLRSVPARELQQLLLRGSHLIIALLDKAKLEQGSACLQQGSACLQQCSPAGAEPAGYKGHYVVLCGYDSEADAFLLRDPDPHPRASAGGLCSVPTAVLDAARTAFGTDEDLLLVRLPQQQGAV